MLLLARFTVLLHFCIISAYASVASDVLNAIENAVDCTSCHTLLGVLKPVTLLGDTAFSSALVSVCKATGAEDSDVCKGLLTQQGPIIAHDLRSISTLGQTATKFCNALIGLCQAPTVNPYTIPFPKAAPTNPKVFTTKGRTPFQVGHFSDVHLDRKYVVGADANCTKPICCRDYGSTNPVTVPAGPFGSPHCDTPTSLMRSLLSSVATNNPQFSLFTGDVVNAAVWLVSQAENTLDMQTFNAGMATFLNTPVYPAIGNHESVPVNSFPRNTTDEGQVQWIFDIQSAGWSSMIGTTAASQVQHMSGSYSVIPPGQNLRIISLNTIYWYKLNLYLYDSEQPQPDPNGVLGFAVEQLQAAEDAGQRAWIVAHMPPNGGDALHDQSNYFNQVVQRYKNTIAAQFFGHTHKDEFAIAYSNYSSQTAATANSVAYIAPPITPRDAHSTYRIYDVDPDTYEVMDARTFFSNTSDPSFQKSAIWKQEYSARALYGSAIGGWAASSPLNATFWHKVTEAFVSNDGLFQQFISLKTRGVKVSPCTGSCKTNTICGLRALRAENNCIVDTPGIKFQRRDNESAVTDASDFSNDCETTDVRTILGSVAQKLHEIDRDALLQELEDTFSQASNDG